MAEFWEGADSHIAQAPDIVGSVDADMVSLPSTVKFYVSAGVEGEKSERFCTKYGKCKPGEVTWDAYDQYGGRCVTRPALGDKKYTDCDKSGYTSSKCPWRRCSKVIPSLHCPKFGSAVASSASSANPGVYDGRAITCEYSRDLIGTSCEQVSAFTDAYRKATGDDKWFDDDLMHRVCSKRGPPEKCLDKGSGYVDPLTGEYICSNMLVCPKCQEWALTKPGVADTLMREWCEAHTDPLAPLDPKKSDPACACINREYDPAVAEMQRYAMVKPGCWYPPCATGGLKKYLRPESDAPKPGDCPDKICNIIWDLKHNTDIDIGKITQIIDCGEDPHPSPTPGPKPDPTDPDSPIPIPDWKDMSNGQKIALVGGAGALGVILLATTIYVMKRK